MNCQGKSFLEFLASLFNLLLWLWLKVLKGTNALTHATCKPKQESNRIGVRYHGWNSISGRWPCYPFELDLLPVYCHMCCMTIHSEPQELTLNRFRRSHLQHILHQAPTLQAQQHPKNPPCRCVGLLILEDKSQKKNSRSLSSTWQIVVNIINSIAYKEPLAA